MPNRVVSKYFSTETGMDDSLSEFQEKKKFNHGPKNVKKTRNTKKLKCTRGQKDIRALIKKQENDVLSYSKDFDKVCKQAGVDVDSEELQLAIALSKSLNEVKKEASSETETLSAVQCLTSQQRTLKIKTTLQEYGFRVPKTKITDPNRKKKCCKQYKLLLISDAERRQIISDKYSEVLVGNIFKSPAKVSECDYNDIELYYKTTNIAYEYIKNDDVYYVKDLFSKPGHKTSVLRDWSEIPGRPLSPTVEIKNINFDDIILCDQHELDCLLSGSIFTAQKIITYKTADISYNIDITIGNKIQMKQDESEPLENKVRHKDDVSDIKLFKETKLYMNSNTMSVSQVRSVSPDLFDDEPSTVMECTDIDTQVSRRTVSMTENVLTYCMDLTECVNVDMNICTKTNQHTSNEINITNRKSNDFMEITKCVSTSLNQVSVERQNLNVPNNQSSNVLTQNENTVIMDLTQVPDHEVKVWDSKQNNSFNETIILVDHDLHFKLQPQKHNFAITEISDPICIDDMINCKENSDIGDCDDNSNLSATDCKPKTNKQNFLKSYLNDETNFEKTSDKSKNNTSTEKDEGKLTDSYQSNWDNKRLSNKNKHKSGQHTNEQVECQLDEIDLTQDSNSSRGESDQPILNYTMSLGKRDNISIDYDEIHDNIANRSNSQTSLKLGTMRNEGESIEKKTYMSNMYNVSNPIQNSEVFKFSNNEYNCALDQSKHDTFDLRDNITFREDENSFDGKEHNTSNNDIASNPSLEVFEISDKELNYSLHKSKHDTFDFGGVPVISGFSNFASNAIREGNRNNCGIIHRALSEKNLTSPFTVTKSHKLNLSSEISTPIRLPNGNINNLLQTPKNSDFIIKTNEVTPMFDYASMSSPERHKELEKYGLKPFKRKRAIQLLTYLYNQTHPLVESHDDCPSPSKRQKKDDGDKLINSPKKSYKNAPLESISMPSKALLKGSEPEINLVNDLYAVTNEQPDIRNIVCEADEWVFQKREKAKLQSCRVPLHIAFHNYVTCRRRLREAILRYEPVNIDVIHKDLVATGYRYHPKDLLKFMDRKCITVRTADNNSRNRKS